MFASSSRKAAVVPLRSRVEQCVADLRALNGLHIELDRPEHQVHETQNTIILPLRKVYFHLRAITCWPINDQTLHLVAPDARAAQWQLRPLVREILQSDQKDVLFIEKLLALFCHPTPVQLIHSVDAGGFRETDESIYFARLYMVMAGLIADYGLCLGILSDDSNESEGSKITEIVTRVSSDARSLSLDKLLGPRECG